jgi:hypothetical protein
MFSYWPKSPSGDSLSRSAPELRITTRRVLMRNSGALRREQPAALEAGERTEAGRLEPRGEQVAAPQVAVLPQAQLAVTPRSACRLSLPPAQGAKP